MRSTPLAPPQSFREGVDQDDLELRGVRARAFQFPGARHDPSRALLCIAGMGADGRSFARQRPLASEAWPLLLNLPYDTPRGADPIEFACEVIEEYVAHERLDRPVILGSSFGGAVAARVALRRRVRPRALVLAGAVLSRRAIPLASPWFVDLLEAPEPLARLVSPLAAQVMGGFALDRDGRDELVREARHFTGPELKRRLLALMSLDLAPELPSIDVPVLAVHGARDYLVGWRRARALVEKIPGARFALIRRAGHVPYLSHPDAFNEAVAGFLRELGWGAAPATPQDSTAAGDTHGAGPAAAGACRR